MRGTVAVLAAASTFGCASLGPIAPAEERPSPQLPMVVLKERSREAVRRIESAVARGDASGVAAEFAGDGLLVAESGDSIRGRAAVERYLAETWSGVEFLSVSHDGTESRTHRCTDGIYDQEVAWSATVRIAQGNIALGGRYATKWRVDPAGNVQVEAAYFHPVLAARPGWDAGCDRPEPQRFRTRRWLVAVNPAVVQGTSARGPAAIANALAGRGFSVHFPTRYGTTLDGNLPPSWEEGAEIDAATQSWLLSTRLALSPTVSVELVLNPLSHDYTVIAFRPERTTAAGVDIGPELTIDSRGKEVALVAAYLKSGVRVGVGPVLQDTEWHVVERELQISSPVPGLHRNGVRVTTADEHWRSLSFGGIVQVGGSYALSSRLFGDVRGNYRLMVPSETRGTDNGPRMSISNGGWSLGLGLGWAF